MQKIGRLLALVTALLAASAVHAQRAPVPIIDHPNVPIATGSGKPAPIDAVKRAIVDGGAAGARKWVIVPHGNGLRGTYKVRSHTVVVDIAARPDSFSLKYADSINMKYDLENGTPVIHPFYNRWVDELLESIRLEMSKL
jgi:hypothetical protein